MLQIFILFSNISCAAHKKKLKSYLLDRQIFVPVYIISWILYECNAS